MAELPFRDRAEAGGLLGAELATHRLEKPVVLALPRGGLPVGAEVARALHAPLDVLVVRKLGVPWQPELAMGAIAGSTPLLDWEIISSLNISQVQLEAVVVREMKEMERREKLYRDGRPAVDLRGRTVVLVDDGLATGSTMLAAARQARKSEPTKLIVAVPVASSDACSRLESEADECICLAHPEPFHSVGTWYADFSQVTDEEVSAILRTSRNPAFI